MKTTSSDILLVSVGTTQHNKVNGSKFKFQKAAIISLILHKTIKIAMKRNGHNDDAVKISANTNTLKSVMEIQGDIQVDFIARNSISSILGF